MDISLSGGISVGAIAHFDGNSWFGMETIGVGELHGIWGIDGADIFAVGQQGSILHYDGRQ